MHKLCLPANPHETFLDQLTSAEPDREFQEERKRFLSVTVASGYLSYPNVLLFHVQVGADRSFVHLMVNRLYTGVRLGLGPDKIAPWEGCHEIL